ncbi:unnamed protein product [Merluccius merluccius]
MKNTGNFGATSTLLSLTVMASTSAPGSCQRQMVDKQMELLVFCWRRRQQQQVGRVHLPLKPTFRYHFSWERDHKQRSIGIDASKPLSLRGH